MNWNRSFLMRWASLKDFNLIESEYFLNNELKAGASILAEGAQGALVGH